MKLLSIEETADLLTNPTTTIIETIHMGASIAHECVDANGIRFVLVNRGSNGESIVVTV
ncbi:hypothetical protein [Pseudoduganella danionis]|uniref:hypothetical protein n=1 Tax=Pseudoduganella danionis TaxID=1890295 RepID=UPI0035AE9089